MNQTALTAITAASAAVALAAVATVIFQSKRNTALAREVAQLRVGQVNVLGAGAVSTTPPAAASDAAEALPPPPPPTRAAAVRTLTDLFALRDPVARTQALLDFAESLPPEQFASILQHIRETRPEWDSEAKLVRTVLLGKWGKSDHAAAFASLEGLDMKERGEDSLAVLAGLASADVTAAKAWLDDPENELANLPMMGHFLAATIGAQYVRDDPDAAMAWAKDLPLSQRGGAHHGILRTLAATDPARAAGYAAGLDPQGDREKLIGNIAGSWGRRSPEDAIAWAGSLDGEDRRQAMRDALGGWASSAPTDAATYVASLPEQERQNAIGPVAEAFARQDPVAAADWVSGQPDGDGKNDGMRRVIGNWVTSDPPAASAWLGAQPDGPARDQGIVSLAVSTFDADPVAAITWASDIVDPGLRHGALEKGLREYMKREPEAAATWMADSPVMTPELWKSLAK